MLDHRLRVDGSLFYILWKNIQTDAVAACTYPDVVNAGGATSKGFDLAIDFFPEERTDLRVALAFIDARYSSTVRPGADVIMERGTAVGGALYSSPPWSGTIFAEHRVPLGGGLSLDAGVDFIARSRNTGPFLEDDPASSAVQPWAAAPIRRRVSSMCASKWPGHRSTTARHSGRALWRSTARSDFDTSAGGRKITHTRRKNFGLAFSDTRGEGRGTANAASEERRASP